MKKTGRHKVSLRMRVVLITGATMIVVCILLSSVILYNTETWIIAPTELGGDSVTFPTSMGFAEEIPPDSVVSAMPDGEIFTAANITNFYLFTLAGIVLSLIIGVVLIYFVTGISLRPVKSLRDSIAAVHETDLSKRIWNFSAGDELDSLAKAFNQMLDRIENAFDREKSFSSGAAHELKTPLAVIKTNLDVIQMSDSPTKEEYEDTLSVVKKQVERMTKLVDDLFAMCALNGYEIGESVRVDKLLEEIISEQAAPAKERKIAVHVLGTHSTVKANFVMLKHAMANIIQNAIKYNVVGGAVYITASEQNGRLEVAVADTGIGISSQAAQHIFEPFFREDNSRSRRIGGAGLGLSIAINIVEQHGGTLQYKPNEPKGSVFIVSLPVQ